MGHGRRRYARRIAFVAWVMAVALAAPAGAADADKTYVMKLSTATLNDSQHEWIKEYVAAVEKDSGGRIKAEIYPASQLGTTPRQIEGTQLGSIQGVILPPEFMVGVDERFEVLSAAGVFHDIEQAERVIADPAFAKMFLALGGDKGLIGVSLFISCPASIITRNPVRHLAEFKGLKLRVLASSFQNEQIARLGATPVAMTLGDVMPGLQQGTIDGAVATVTSFTPLHFYEAAKYLTETGQSYVFSVTELSKRWFDGLPADLQKILVEDGAKEARAIVPWQLKFIAEQRQLWVAKGGEIIALPQDEQDRMVKNLASSNDDLTKSKPALKASYDALLAAAARAK
jgi:TRAP-type C4-dicarboxylate transport system substrate-binding protein